MHISASRAALASALAVVAKALPARPANPALAGVALQTVSAGDSSVLVLTAGDGENWIRTRIACTADVEDVVVIPGAAFAELVKDLPGDEIDITVDAERVSLKLKRGAYSLPRFAEVPIGTPKLEDPQLMVPGGELAEAIARASAAVARNQTTPVLSGVRLEVSENVLTFASTDRYRLAVTRAECSDDDSSFETIVPAKQLGDVAKVLGKAEVVGVSYQDGTIAFSTADTAVFVRELAGEYPAWRRLLATEPTTWVEVATDELLGAVRRTGRFSPDVISLLVSAESVVVSAAGTEAGSGSEDVPAVATPAVEEDVELKFNPQILLDGLATAGADTVRIGFTDPQKPVLVTAGDDHTYLAMPRR